MQIHSLRTFYWVTRLSSFRKAAEVLNISQPTVSARIRGLEEELGVPLLLRDPALTLTEQGEELLDYARTVLRLTEDLSFHRGAELREERLRLGANGPVSASWLMPLVSRLEAAHPGLRLEIEVNQSATLLRHMASGQLDIAFVSRDTAEGALRLRPLGAFAMCWVARPGLVEAAGPLGEEALGRLPIIGYSWDSPVHGPTHAPAFGPARHRRFTQSDSLFMMIRMAVEGAGLALVPAAAVERELALGLLVPVATEVPAAPLPIHCALPRSRASAPALRAARLAEEAMARLSA